VLQRGDDIEIKVFNMPELAEAARIRPDGKISALLLNDVQAAGLTPAQLGEFLSAEYGKQFRNPRVTVIVRNFSSETVFVGGEVAQPGILPLRGELRIAQAIFQAGGVRETGRLDNVVLVRNENGQAVATRINLLKVMKAGRGNLPLQPFDIVYVPKTKVAKVDQFVRQYIRDAVPASLNAGFSYLLGATVLR
jgi:protein involved in polysaccharide export with SLBB domain